MPVFVKDELFCGDQPPAHRKQQQAQCERQSVIQYRSASTTMCIPFVDPRVKQNDTSSNCSSISDSSLTSSSNTLTSEFESSTYEYGNDVSKSTHNGGSVAQHFQPTHNATKVYFFDQENQQLYAADHLEYHTDLSYMVSSTASKPAAIQPLVIPNSQNCYPLVNSSAESNMPPYIGPINSQVHWHQQQATYPSTFQEGTHNQFAQQIYPSTFQEGSHSQFTSTNAKNLEQYDNIEVKDEVKCEELIKLPIEDKKNKNIKIPLVKNAQTADIEKFKLIMPPSPINLACGWRGCTKQKIRYTTIESVVAHLKADHINHPVPYLCAWRGCIRKSTQTFGSRTKLLEHIRTVHFQDRRYKCKLCPDKGFTRQNKLTSHIMAHLGVKPFQCHEPGCLASFTHSADHRRHMVVHSDERSFKCSECSKAYKHQYSLCKHRRVVHGIIPSKLKASENNDHDTDVDCYPPMEKTQPIVVSASDSTNQLSHYQHMLPPTPPDSSFDSTFLNSNSPVPVLFAASPIVYQAVDSPQ